MKNTIIRFCILCIALFIYQSATAQGCVAIRHFSCSDGAVNNGLVSLSKGEWQVGTNYRYFRSFRHFKGLDEQPERVELHTEVINWSHALDLNFSYGINHRLFASLALPFVYNERSSLYEHGRSSRHKSYSGGLADMRLGLGYWIYDPATHPGGNLSLSLGLKLPTGDFAATSKFYNVGQDGAAEIRPVDQSIQPGDGGLGLTLDLQAFSQLMPRLFAYAGGFYLANPRQTNGTRTFRETLSPVLQNEAITSVPDQFGLRGGLSYATPLHLAIALGARFEGVPVRDLIGGSAGFRRPGYVLSVEPGLSYMAGPLSLNLNVPVAVLRKRTQSVTDRQTEINTGQPRNGDAAFADYLISLGASLRFGGHKKMEIPVNMPVFNNQE